MSELISTSAKVIYREEDGTILLEGNLIDIAHLIGFVTLEARKRNPEMSMIDVAKAQVAAVNKEFNSTLSWGQMVDLATHIRNEMEELKKKNCSQEQE